MDAECLECSCSPSPAENGKLVVATSCAVVNAECHLPERAHDTSPPIVTRGGIEHNDVSLSSVTENHHDDYGRTEGRRALSSSSSANEGARRSRSDPSPARDGNEELLRADTSWADAAAGESSSSSVNGGARRSRSDPSPRHDGNEESLRAGTSRADAAAGESSSSSANGDAQRSRSDPSPRHDGNEESLRAGTSRADAAAGESSSSSANGGAQRSRSDPSPRHDDKGDSLRADTSRADAATGESSSASAASDKKIPAEMYTPPGESSSLVASLAENILPTRVREDVDDEAPPISHACVDDEAPPISHTCVDDEAPRVHHQFPHSMLAGTIDPTSTEVTPAVYPVPSSCGATAQPPRTFRRLMSSFLPACQPSPTSSPRASREPSTSSEGRTKINGGHASGAVIAALAASASHSPARSRSQKSPRSGSNEMATPSLVPPRTRSPEGAIDTKVESPRQGGNGISNAEANFEREVSLLVAEKLALQEEVARLKKEQDGATAHHHVPASSSQSSPRTILLPSAHAVAKWDNFLGASKDAIQSGLDRTRSKVAEVVDTLQKNPFQVGTVCEVMERGAVVRATESLDSAKVTFLPQGVLVKIEEMNGRRARVKSDKTEGWLSVTSTHGRQLLRHRPDLNVDTKGNEAEVAEARAAIEDTFVAVAQDDLVALHKKVQRLTVENTVYKEEHEKAQRLSQDLAEKVKRQEAELRQCFEWQTEVRKLKRLLASERRGTALLSREHECMLREDARSGFILAREQRSARDKAEREIRARVDVSAVPDVPATAAEKEAPTEETKRACDGDDGKDTASVLKEKLRDLEVQYIASQRKTEKETVVLRQTLRQIMGPKTCDDSSNWLYLARIADLEQKVEEFRRKAVLHVPTAKMLSRYLESQASVHCFSVIGSKASRECDLKGLVEEVLQENLRLLAEQSKVIERTDAS